MAASATAYSEEHALALADALRKRISGEVRFDDGSRALYATDASNYRQPPIGVVIPKTVEDVIATVRLCREYDLPIFSRGGGTSLAGQCCNTAVVMDFSKYLNRIVDIDTERRTATVEPGCILDDLRDQAERYNLTFGPDPATHDHNTLGGMIGNNSCGVHSVQAGCTVHNVVALEILTYDGLRMWVGATTEEEYQRILEQGGRRAEIYRRLRALRDRYQDDIRARYPKVPRRVSGYNLDQLLAEDFNIAKALVGSESTLVTILQAKLRLVHSPPYRTLAVLGFEDVYTAGDAVPAVLEHEPVGLEGMDDRLIQYMREKQLKEEYLSLLPEGQGWLLAELGGETRQEADGKADRLIEAMQDMPHLRDARRYSDTAQQTRMWQIRESGLAATAYVPGRPDTWPGWEDSAVPPDKVGQYMRELRKLLERYDYECSLYGHFGDGCIHTRIDFDLTTSAGIKNYRSFLDAAADLVVKLGGSFSGEHGDGQARAELLPKLFGEELVNAFREYKGIWDPRGKMNPGKVVDPYPITENLRLGADFDPPKLDTYFAYLQEHGDFAHATQRCVGVGVCRHVKPTDKVMCPSFQATREEKHTTRGRARMLFEMIKGEMEDGTPLTKGWQSKPVQEALSLCLACKGCKVDCPVNVDMATYKSEFNAHYYKKRLRPRAAYSMGLIYYYARAASHAPRFANALARAPVIGRIGKWAGGIAPQREITPFAEESFQAWFGRREPNTKGGKRVLLWPDTFNNHFRPEVGKATVAVLESAGYQVVLPDKPLCCGRPLYAWGMLDLAKKQLGQTMDALEEEIEAGTPIVAMEPACFASFQDELPGLFPKDERARELARLTQLLPQFLVDEGYEPPKLDRKALMHVHCHQHATVGAQADQKLLEQMGVDCRVLDSGCCGMAGSFGFEAEHYEVSMTRAEQVLLPETRAAEGNPLLITNGFSCHEQVRQGADYDYLHMAQILKLALGKQRRHS